MLLRFLFLSLFHLCNAQIALMNLHERVLSVLGCRSVDDVLIDAPFEITEEMIASLKITEVLTSPDTDYGTQNDFNRFGRISKDVVHTIEQPCKFSLGSILQRIRRNQDHFQTRFERKMNAERQFYEKKHSVNGHSHEKFLVSTL